MLVNGVCINKLLLSQWLERLVARDWSKRTIFALLNPDDAQDVPHAIDLICSITELCNLDSEACSPNEQSVFVALSLLGDVLNSLIIPFITPQ